MPVVLPAGNFFGGNPGALLPALLQSGLLQQLQQSSQAAQPGSTQLNPVSPPDPTAVLLSQIAGTAGLGSALNALGPQNQTLGQILGGIGSAANIPAQLLGPGSPASQALGVAGSVGSLGQIGAQQFGQQGLANLLGGVGGGLGVGSGILSALEGNSAGAVSQIGSSLLSLLGASGPAALLSLSFALPGLFGGTARRRAANQLQNSVPGFRQILTSGLALDQAVAQLDPQNRLAVQQVLSNPNAATTLAGFVPGGFPTLQEIATEFGIELKPLPGPEEIAQIKAEEFANLGSGGP